METSKSSAEALNRLWEKAAEDMAEAAGNRDQAAMADAQACLTAIEVLRARMGDG